LNWWKFSHKTELQSWLRNEDGDVAVLPLFTSAVNQIDLLKSIVQKKKREKPRVHSQMVGANGQSTSTINNCFVMFDYSYSYSISY